MIQTTPIPIDESDKSALRQWLRSSEAELFRAVLQTNIARHQAIAGHEMIEFVIGKNSQDQTAREHAEEAARFLAALEIFEQCKVNDSLLISLSISATDNTIIEPLT